MLRGSREERVEEMLSLKEAEWNLGTLLYLHLGLLDHSEDVRLAALDALMGIAERSPEPFTVSPIPILADYIFSVTVSSGYTPHIFEFLVRLGTPEAVQTVEKLIREPCRNDDFRYFVDVLIREGELGLLGRLEKEKLSKTKAKLLRDALDRTEREPH